MLGGLEPSEHFLSDSEILIRILQTPFKFKFAYQVRMKYHGEGWEWIWTGISCSSTRVSNWWSSNFKKLPTRTFFFKIRKKKKKIPSHIYIFVIYKTYYTVIQLKVFDHHHHASSCPPSYYYPTGDKLLVLNFSLPKQNRRWSIRQVFSHEPRLHGMLSFSQFDIVIHQNMRHHDFHNNDRKKPPWTE